MSKFVYLVRTPEGLSIALLHAERGGCEVWCGSDAISDADYKEHSGVPLSRFNFSLVDVDDGALRGALETVQEHHPGLVVLVEGMGTNRQFLPAKFEGK